MNNESLLQIKNLLIGANVPLLIHPVFTNLLYFKWGIAIVVLFCVVLRADSLFCCLLKLSLEAKHV
jgi:hypothetical protein